MLKRHRRGEVASALLARCLRVIESPEFLRKSVWSIEHDTKASSDAKLFAFDSVVQCRFLDDKPSDWNWTTLEDAKKQSAPLPNVTDVRLGDVL